MEEVAPLIHSRLVSIRSAFKAVDPYETGLVSKNDFRRVLKSLLCFSQRQLNTVLDEVCDGSVGTVDYMRFLRRFSRGPVATTRSSSSSIGSSRRSSDVRGGPKNTSMSLSELQKHLKHKIGGNLRTVIRAFRLFDHSRDGHIERHEFRRILENYCIPLTNKEFQRLWHHYSPSNMAKISYELFLDKLGFGDGHNFKISPVCTKLTVSSAGTTLGQRKQGTESQSSFCDAPSAGSHGNLQADFHDKMCRKSALVWRALQAFDTTCSGLVTQDVLRAVLSSFIFSIDLHSFQKLTSSYGVRATGLVRWKHFLGHFMSRHEGDAQPHTDRSFEPRAPDDDSSDFPDIYPRLKEAFHLLDVKEGGGITQADLQRWLGGPAGSQPQIPHQSLEHSRINELFNVLDPEHTGVIQLDSLKRLNPSVTSAPTGNTAPLPSPGNAAERPGVAEGPERTAAASEERKTADERETTQWADRVSAASAATVDGRLLGNLCERLSSLLAALEQRDPQRTGYVPREDLKKVLSCCGVPVSDTHFHELCDSFGSRTGSSSTLVSYRGFLKHLGVPTANGKNTLSSREDSCHTQRLRTSPESTLQPVCRHRSPSSSRGGAETCCILDIVFRRMRSRLEQRHTCLTDRIQALIPSSDAVDLSETDLRKIVEDSWVILDNENFNEFTKCLGVTDGRIGRSTFRAKHEEATAAGQPASDGGDEKVVPLRTSAEQCLAALKTRIKVTLGDSLTAFRLMDRKCNGVVDCHDFKALFNSLGLSCSGGEYKRLLGLIGLHPGRKLNYAAFADVVENNGKQGAPSADVQEQLHELLASEARRKWADMSKVLCQFDAGGEGRVSKKSLRALLFTYALPMGSSEFDRLWSRYDPEGRGSVAVCDFLERLGFRRDGEQRVRSEKANRTAHQLDAHQSVSADTASLEPHIKQILLENYEELSQALTHLDTGRDGTVTVEELLSLLHTYSRSIPREQLIHHLHRLSVYIDENTERLPYVDFLSAFDHKAEKTSQPPPPPPDAVRRTESLESLSPDMALVKMQELVTSSAANLFKAFSAFDQGRTGTVKVLEFRRVLESFCARTSDKQYRHLLTRLELDREKSTVNWKDFLNKFQMHGPLVSQRPLSGSREHDPKLGPPVQTSGIRCPQQMPEELTDVVTSNTVSSEQLRQLCDRRCLSLTKDQFKRVRRHMPKTEQKKLQHGEFQKHFEKLGRFIHNEAESPTNNILPPFPEPRHTDSAISLHCLNTARANLPRTQSAPQCTSRRRVSMGRPGTGSPSGSMERRLRGAVQHCWREIQWKCAAEDSQQEGHISTSSFLRILRSLSIGVTQEQFESLAVRFNFTNNGCVLYQNFLQHFLLNLNPAETTKAFERLKLPLPITPTSRGVLSKSGVEVMLRIYDAVRSAWASMRRSFLACDRTRTGSVSVQDFRKVLFHFGVSLSEEDFFHLCCYFDAEATGKICYNTFLWAFLH